MSKVYSKEVINLELLKAHGAMQNMSFQLQCSETTGTQAIHQEITDHFTSTSANVIYCIPCTLAKKKYISKTGRQLEHLHVIEKDDKNTSK